MVPSLAAIVQLDIEDVYWAVRKSSFLCQVFCSEKSETSAEVTLLAEQPLTSVAQELPEIKRRNNNNCLFF